jgi:hypothetical protein
MFISLDFEYLAILVQGKIGCGGRNSIYDVSLIVFDMSEKSNRKMT